MSDKDLEDLQKVLEDYRRIKPTLFESGRTSIKRLPEETTNSELLRNKYEECWRTNERCQSLMRKVEGILLFLLDGCTRELSLVAEEKIAVQSGKCFAHKFHRVHAVCCRPYFKDNNSFPAPCNEDAKLRDVLGYIDVCNPPKRNTWTEEQKKTLEDSIRKTEIERWTKIAQKAGTEEFCDFESKSLAELIGTRKDEYDWMKISVTDLKNVRSPLECQAIWFNYLHPAINRGRWTPEEDKALIKLVEKYKHQNWDRITEELNTNRSAYQCIVHYRCRLNDYSNVPWTKEENENVKKYVEQFSVGNYIPWVKVAWYLENRSQHEIYRHWELINPDAKKGRYSLEEDIVIATCVQYFGNDYSRIAEYLPNRNNVQVRSRVQVLISHQQVSPWTADEDMLLCQLVEKYGFGNWSKISNHFLNRTNNNVRCRYKAILCWKAKHGEDSMPLGHKPIPNYNGNMKELWERAKQIVRAKQIAPTCDDDDDKIPNIKVVHELSRALMHKPKVGRKKGMGKPVDVLDREFYKFFNSGYVQKGGKGKNLVSKELLPTLVKDMILNLNLVNAQLILPISTETIEEDCSFPEVDKILLTFLIERRDIVENIYESRRAAFEEPRGSVLYLCPPNITTFIGLRTLLLKRKSLRDQARGMTCKKYTGPVKRSTDPDSKALFQHACKNWLNRLHFLFTWGAYASKLEPNKACTVVPQETIKYHSYGLKEEISQERIKRKKVKKKLVRKTKPDSEKREYKKTGKYKIGSSDAPIRRSKRLSKPADDSDNATNAANNNAIAGSAESGEFIECEKNLTLLTKNVV